MKVFKEDHQGEIWLANSEQINNDYIPAGTPVIKIQEGGEYLFDRKTIENMISSFTPDLLNTFKISIEKVKEDRWVVKFGSLPEDIIHIKTRFE